MIKIHGKERREHRRRNFYAKELHEPRFGPRVVQEKRRHKLDQLHEQESEEQLDEYLEDHDE